MVMCDVQTSFLSVEIHQYEGMNHKTVVICKQICMLSSEQRGEGFEQRKHVSGKT